MDDTEARERVARVETLLEEVESLADPAARDKATEVVQALLELYGEGLGRIVEQAAARDEDGELARALADDELVSHLLLLHGLHPVPLEARVDEALEGVRPYLDSHGGNVELVSVHDGVVRLAMQGSCNGCPSSAMTLKLAIEEAIHKAAPDVVEIEAEGAAAPAPTPAPGLLQIQGVDGQGGAGAGPDLLQIEVSDAARGPAVEPAAGDGSWAMVGGMPDLKAGSADRPVLRDVAGEPVLFLELEGTLYAYRPDCPGCGESLAAAQLSAGQVACPGCGNRYDVRFAGRCAQAPERQLQPVPLLVDDAGLVKVALGSAA